MIGYFSLFESNTVGSLTTRKTYGLKGYSDSCPMYLATKGGWRLTPPVYQLKKEAGRYFGLVRVSIPNPQEPVNGHTFHFSLDRERLRRTLRREGRYLLRSNMQATSPETVWEFYLLLTRIEQAFKYLKGSLSIRPRFMLQDR